MQFIVHNLGMFSIVLCCSCQTLQFCECSSYCRLHHLSPRAVIAVSLLCSESCEIANDQEWLQADLPHLAREYAGSDQRLESP